MKFTKGRIKELRKGIVPDAEVTPEQEAMIRHFGIPVYWELESSERVRMLQNRIDGILKKLSRKK